MELDSIRRAVAETEGLEDVILLRTEHRGPEKLLVALVALTVGAPPRSTTGKLARAINEAEERIRATVPGARYIFIEPDLRREVEEP